MKKGELLAKLCLEIGKILQKSNNFPNHQQIDEKAIEMEYYKLSFVQSKYLNPLLEQNTRNLNDLREYLQKPIIKWGVNEFQEYAQIFTDPLFRKVDEATSPFITILGQPTEIFNQIVMEAKKIEKSGKQYLITDIRDQLEGNRKAENREMQELYIKFRRFLIEHPIIEKFDEDFTQIQTKVKIAKLEYYEPISAHQQYDGFTFLCPVCRYPLNLTPIKKEWSCPSLWCQEKEVFFRYETHPLNLKVHHRHDIPIKIEINKFLQILKDLWRFTTVPGLIELELHDKVRELGFDTLLWPNFDHLGDLEIYFSKEKSLFVDAKCWLNPTNLHNHLLEHEEKIQGQEYWKNELKSKIIIIPNFQEKLIPMIQRDLKIYQIYTVNQFISKLKEGNTNAF